VSEPIRIANCSGFYGDRLAAAAEMVEGRPDRRPDRRLAGRAHHADPGPHAGEAPRRGVRTQLRRPDGARHGHCLERGIKVVSNAGGLDPAGCAEAVRALGAPARPGAQRRLRERRQPLAEARRAEGCGHRARPLRDRPAARDTSGFLTANAYLGCFGIVEALNRGCGHRGDGSGDRTRLSLCGPAAWPPRLGTRRLGRARGRGSWPPRHRVRRAGDGGNYSFFTEVAGMTHVGSLGGGGGRRFLCHRQARRHRGEVSVGTVTFPALYEIGGPEYYGPT